jgi:tRNA (cytidine/uridine-2'-O-)-methyltransferase
MLHVVQYHPAIPQNTGNIARSTVGFGAHLHLIHPMAFAITEQAVKRAGLDYWPYVKLIEHDSDERFLDWLEQHMRSTGRPPWLVTKFGRTRFDHADYADGDVLIFGNENTGLPKAWHQRWPDRGLMIPMPNADASNIRSYNVANTVAIVLATATCRVLDG